MIFFLGIIGLVIAVIVLTVRYIRVNAKVLSRSEFKNAAEKQAARISCHFKCADDPSADFSTGYIKINENRK